MGWEPVFYKDKWFEINNIVISRLQKFMELFLKQFEHPLWFNEILEDLEGNFHVPHGKYFFDDELIDGNDEKFNYAIKMLDLTIEKLETINFIEFRDFIKTDIKGTWCNFDDNSIFELTPELKRIYKKKYIGSLKKLKEIMLKN